MAVQRYGECITEEAEKKAGHEATPTEIASAVVADCEYIFAFYRNAQIDYANARYQYASARITFIRGIDNVIADARENGRGKALSRVISIRSNLPRQK